MHLSMLFVCVCVCVFFGFCVFTCLKKAGKCVFKGIGCEGSGTDVVIICSLFLR